MSQGLHEIGKILISISLIIFVIGLFLFFGNKIPLLGRLPGDIFLKGKNFIFYFPIVTSLILSLIISLILYFLRKSKSP
ncbi:MAG: DUF2905 domain-containing protein [Ignavibacteriaceae bacterium]